MGHRPEMDRHHMRKIREVLRLHFDTQLTQRQISASTGVSKGTVSNYLARAAATGLTWAEAREMGDAEVESPRCSQLLRTLVDLTNRTCAIVRTPLRHMPQQ